MVIKAYLNFMLIKTTHIYYFQLDSKLSEIFTFATKIWHSPTDTDIKGGEVYFFLSSMLYIFTVTTS